MNRRSFTFAMVAIAVGVAVFFGWRAFRPGPPPQLATSPATVKDIEYTVLASGTLQASQMVSVGAQASGQIKSLKVKLGDRVKAGDLVAEIDSTTEEIALRNAEAALASLRAQRNVQVATLKQSQLTFDRQKMMLAEEATARADYETAEAQLAIARAQIESLDAQIVQGQTTLDTAKATLGYTKIKAPLDGTVVAIVAKEGQTVNAVQTTPTIIKLAQLDTIMVSAEISEADIAKVRAGDTVYFTTLGAPERRYYGKLRTIEPAPASIATDTTSTASSASASATSNAVYYSGQFEVPNADGALRISMTAQVYIILGDAKSALTIPAAALGAAEKDGSYVVRVLERPGEALSRKVRVGINNNVDAQVLSGLREGELVVVGDAADKTIDPRRRGLIF